MFNPEINESQIDAVSLELIRKSPFDANGRPIFIPGFRLQRHSINQVTEANEYLKTVIAKGREFTTDEYIWVRNERALCSIDFLYWATRYGWIINWESDAVLFDPNVPQRIILEQFSEMEAQGIAILVLILKARQEGVTTLSELIMLWKAIFHPFTNVVVASSNPKKSAEMSEKMEFCLKRQPVWLVPAVETYNVGELIGFDSQSSAIYIGHGSSEKSDLGRGATKSAFHLSEVTEFLHPAQDIDAALLEAIHDNPRAIGILETTGKSRYGWYYDKWNFSVENWPKGQARLCPIFLPYYALRDIYPPPAWLRSHPVNWEGDIPEIVLAHAQRANTYVQGGTNPMLTKLLGATWEMPQEVMWHWWISRKEFAANNKLNDFYRERASDDKEAFQSDNSTIFPVEVIENYRNFRRAPEAVYGIIAPQAEIPVLLQAREGDIDRSRPPIDIRANWLPTGQPHDYRLVPLLHRGSAEFSPNGKIIVYEHPHPNEEYLLGTDTGFGLGKDNSVIQGLRKGSAHRNDEQVFEFSSPQVNSFALWPFNLALGTLYATNRDGKRRQPRQVIEGAANGEVVHNELKKRGWSSFHNWVRYDKKRIQEFKATRELWYTTSWSRPLMFDMLLDALNNGWLEINSPWFINEMEDLELFENNKIAAAVSSHDDRLMALGIALFSAHANETRGRDGWVGRAKARGDTSPEVYASYTPGGQGSADAHMEDTRPASTTYRVIGPAHPDYDLLSPAGPTIWTPPH